MGASLMDPPASPLPRVRIQREDSSSVAGRRKPRWDSMFMICNPEHPQWSPTYLRRPDTRRLRAVRESMAAAPAGFGSSTGRGLNTQASEPKVKLKTPLVWHTQGWKLRPALNEAERQRRFQSPAAGTARRELPEADYRQRLTVLAASHTHKHTHVESGITHTHRTVIRRMLPRTPVDIVFNQTVLYDELKEQIELIDHTLEAIRIKTAVEMGELAEDPVAMRSMNLRQAVMHHYSNEASSMLKAVMGHVRTDCGGCAAAACTAAVMDAVVAVTGGPARPGTA